MNPTINLTETITPDERVNLRFEQIMKSLRSLFDDDIEEQKETFSYLEETIDQDRTSTRKRFSS